MQIKGGTERYFNETEKNTQVALQVAVSEWGANCACTQDHESCFASY